MGKSIVNAQSFKMDLSLFLCSHTGFLLDSAFVGIYGNGCPSCLHTHVHAHTHAWAYVHTNLSTGALEAVSRASALQLILLFI